ncbi:MAG: hypothetical protein GY870_19320 [archaeon]|nr:hypothetical protein [archaeon]
MAGLENENILTKKINYDLFVLNSYFYLRKTKSELIKKYSSFLLDSGAFTYMQNGITVDWNKYVDEYAQYIIDNNIKNYIEMDIDVIVGVQEAYKLRQRLEARTQTQSIPCWHKIRGKEAWIEMVKNYNYVSISVSGFTDTSKWIRKHKYKPLYWFLEQARKYNCKVHGLGFTQTELLQKFKFFSVDSTTWLKAARFGELSIFKEKKMMRISNKNKKGRSEKIRELNFNEWIKFQKYAKTNL